MFLCPITPSPPFLFFKSLGTIRFLYVANGTMATQHTLQSSFPLTRQSYTSLQTILCTRGQGAVSFYFWGSLCYITVSRKDSDWLPGNNLICLDSLPLKHKATLTDQNWCILQGRDSFHLCQLLETPSLWRLKEYPLPRHSPLLKSPVLGWDTCYGTAL